MQNLVKFRCR